MKTLFLILALVASVSPSRAADPIVRSPWTTKTVPYGGTTSNAWLYWGRDDQANNSAVPFFLGYDSSALSMGALGFSFISFTTNRASILDTNNQTGFFVFNASDSRNVLRYRDLTNVLTGIGSLISNKQPVTIIRLWSPTNATYIGWTNTQPFNVHVVFSGGTVTGVGINSSQWPAPLTGGTIPLQPGEWLFITNSLTPTAAWKPF